MNQRRLGAGSPDGRRGDVSVVARDDAAVRRRAEQLTAGDPAAGRPLVDLVGRLRSRGLVVDLAMTGDASAVAGPAARAPAAGEVAEARTPVDVTVRGVTHDSRLVAPGTLFVAIPGAHADGHDFLVAAARAGASAALVERRDDSVDLPQIIVGSGRRALATAAAWFWGDPSHRLGTIGITGTDGKTTTSFLAAAALEAAGIPTGLVTTIATRIGGLTLETDVHATTPEAPVLQRTLAAMVAAADRAAVVETTSHGLALGRVDEIAYDVAILTNITHEHLELHGSWTAYRDAKRLLFQRLGLHSGVSKPEPPWRPVAVVNADDPSGSLVAADARAAGARVVTYGRGPGADVRIEGVEAARDGLEVRLGGSGGRLEIALRLAGGFNGHNAAAVVALGDALGLDRRAVRDGLASVARIPGRMEQIELGQPFDVVVDYAHSPVSLQVVLGELGPVARRRGGGLIVVFGSAGERDIEKRPLMGRIAGERCRLVILADEDPRGEESMAILEAIAAGARSAGRVDGRDLLLVPDRAAAIRAALAAALPGDTVVLAGKGHERTIIGPDGDRPWDEAAEARAALAELGFQG
jgi:UDP-N-acetylmuramoyl-L-alanyl-D-glutamate--2,6-diaminopimelate ligase